jgi:hypothetical protein
VSSVRSVPRCYKQDKLVERISESVGELVSEIEGCCSPVVVSCCCQNLVAEAGDSWEPRGRGMSVVERRYEAKASGDMTVGNIVCVCVCNSEV